MAYTEYTLDTIQMAQGVGTITVKLLHGDDSLVIPVEATITSIEQLIERVEVKANRLELGDGAIDVVDFADANYPHGFWYYVVVESASLFPEVPELMFLINEGAGDTFLFWGKVDGVLTEIDTIDTDVTFPRRAKISMLNVLKRIGEITWDDLIAYLDVTRGFDDERLGARPAMVLTRHGLNDNVEYSYRVAARTAEGEAEACTEDSIEAAATLTGSDYVTISWTLLSGATEYAVYRTAGGSTQGYIGKTSTAAFDDTGLTAVAIRKSVRRAVTLTDVLRSMVYLAFGGSDILGRVSIEDYDVKIGGVFSEVCILVKRNRGTLDTVNYGLTELFDSTHDNYLGRRHKTPLDWLMDFCKSLGAVPRVFYNVSGTRADIELLTRGKIGAAMTMTGEVTEEKVFADSMFKAPKIRVRAAYGDYYDVQQEYTNLRQAGAEEDYDVDLELSFLVRSDLHTLNVYDSFYKKTGTALGNKIDECTTFEYYDYLAARFVSLGVGPVMTLTRHGTNNSVPYTYKVAAISSEGEVEVCVTASVDAATTLNGSNYVTISWLAMSGFKEYRIYRTAGGPSQGLIGTVTDALFLDDKGLSASTGDAVNVGLWIGRLMQAGLVRYYNLRFNSPNGRTIDRAYRGMKATSGATTSQANVKPLRRIEIDDGNGAVAYFANEVTKDVTGDGLRIRWEKQ